MVAMVQSGFPIAVTQTPNTTNLNGAGQRPNLVPGVDVLAPGDITERLREQYRRQSVSEPERRSRWRPAFTLGNAPFILPGVRSPVRKSVDLAINKDFPTSRTSKATLRLEVINLFNTPWYTRMASASFGNANFAQVTTQGNYSRFAQITVRFNW